MPVFKDDGITAVSLVEAAQAGFATGLASDELEALAAWHGNPHNPGTLIGRVWDKGYGAGRAAAHSTAGTVLEPLNA